MPSKYLPLLVLTQLGCPDVIECQGYYRVEVTGFPEDLDEYTLHIEFEDQVQELPCSASTAEVAADNQLICNGYAEPWGLNLTIQLGEGALLVITHDDFEQSPHGPYRIVLSSPMDPAFSEEYISEFMVHEQYGCEEGYEHWMLVP